MVRECRFSVDLPTSTPMDMKCRLASDTIMAMVEALRGKLKIVSIDYPEIDYSGDKPVLSWKALIDVE